MRLACFHTVCEGCATALLATIADAPAQKPLPPQPYRQQQGMQPQQQAQPLGAAGRRGIVCPVCAAVTGGIVDEVTLSLLRRRDLLLEAQLAADERARAAHHGDDGRCSECASEVAFADAEAAVACTQCTTKLCTDHANLHRKGAATKTHALTAIARASVLGECARHHRKFDSYCATCDALGCPACVLECHQPPQHKSTPATPENKAHAAAALASAAAAGHAHQSELNVRISQLTRATDALGVHADAVRSDIRDGFKAVRAALAAREAALLGEVDAFQTAQTEVLAASTAAHRQVHNALQGPLTAAKELGALEAASDLDVIAVGLPASARLATDIAAPLPVLPVPEKIHFVPVSTLITTIATAGRLQQSPGM